MDFDFISFVLGGVVGAVGTFAIGRSKYNAMRETTRRRVDELVSRVNGLYGEIVTSRMELDSTLDLNKGLALELFDAANKTTTRKRS